MTLGKGNTGIFSGICTLRAEWRALECLMGLKLFYAQNRGKAIAVLKTFPAHGEKNGDVQAAMLRETREIPGGADQKPARAFLIFPLQMHVGGRHLDQALIKIPVRTGRGFAPEKLERLMRLEKFARVEQ